MAGPADKPARRRAAPRGRAALTAARRDFYRFLSGVYRLEPAPATLACLRDPAWRAALADCFSAALAQQFDRVARTLEGEGCLDTLRQEFTRLFLAPGAHYVPAYESVFRDRRDIGGRTVSGLLLGPSALDVQQWYRLAALELSSDCPELPDHIGLELEYLAHLCEREQAFGEAGDRAKQRRAREMQRDFLKAHVLAWLPELAAKLQASATLPFYPALACLTLEFCQADLARLEHALGPASAQGRPAYTA